MIINNTRLIVTKIANHVLEVKIMLGKNIGNIVYNPLMSSLHPNLYRLLNLLKDNSVHLYLYYDNQYISISIIRKFESRSIVHSYFKIKKTENIEDFDS
ncbi:hypothetical protein Lal_00038692 [Lupinus albus]|nr:hypothetical protein Lal_00038692 [Lupinus albus]